MVGTWYTSDNCQMNCPFILFTSATGWPKSSLGLFHTMLQKNQKELFGQINTSKVNSYAGPWVFLLWKQSLSLYCISSPYNLNTWLSLSDFPLYFPLTFYNLYYKQTNILWASFVFDLMPLHWPYSHVLNIFNIHVY